MYATKANLLCLFVMLNHLNMGQRFMNRAVNKLEYMVMKLSRYFLKIYTKKKSLAKSLVFHFFAGGILDEKAFRFSICFGFYSTQQGLFKKKNKQKKCKSPKS